MDRDDIHQMAESIAHMSDWIRKWERVMVPMILLFMVLLVVGFYLVYNVTKNLNAMSEEFVKMNEVMQVQLSQINHTMTDMNAHIHQMSASVQRMDANAAAMNQQLSNVSSNIYHMSANVRQMSGDIGSMNHQMSGPLGALNNMMPFGNQSATPRR